MENLPLTYFHRVFAKCVLKFRVYFDDDYKYINTYLNSNCLFTA